MASEIRIFSVTTPAGTLKAAPLITALAMPPRIVRTVQVIVPPGPNGFMGFAFGAAGQPVIPYNAGAFIITSDEKLSWDIVGQIDSGAWQMFSYNTGFFDHTIQVRFLLDQIGQTSATPAPVIIPADVLNTPTADELAAAADLAAP